MGILPAFAGFPSTGLAFLADLAAHNNRAWFEARKTTPDLLVTKRSLPIRVTERLSTQGS